MNTSVVLTVMGDDRPGLVRALSRVVAEHDGNWVESHMARMAGKFAGIVRVDVPSGRWSALQGALHALAADGLRVTAEPTEDAEAELAATAVTLELTGADHVGIVRDVTAVLAAHAVNVEELATERLAAPWSGEPLFRAQARLRLPPGFRLAVLRGALEALAADLMVDISVKDLP